MSSWRFINATKESHRAMDKQARGHSLDWWSEGCHLKRRHLSASVREEWGVGEGVEDGVLPSGGRGSGPGCRAGVQGPGVSPCPPQVTLGPALQADLPDFCPRRGPSRCHRRAAGVAEIRPPAPSWDGGCPV